MPYWKVIGYRWDNQLYSALDVAAYFLNPQFCFSPEFFKHGEVTKGLNNVMENLIPDEGIQDIMFKQYDDHNECDYETDLRCV